MIMAWSDLAPLTQVEAIFWFAGSGVCLFMFAYFVRKYKRTEFHSRKFFLGLGVFSITFGIARLVETVRKYFVSDSLTDIVDAWLAGGQIEGLNWQLRVLYYVIAWFGISILFYNTEKYVFQKKTKFIITLAAVVEGVISIALYFLVPGSPLFEGLMIGAALGFFVAGLYPIIFLINLARKAVGAVRVNTLVVTLGIVLFIMGVLVDLPETSYLAGDLISLIPFTGLLAPVLLFSGFIIMSVGFMRLYSTD